MTEYTIRWYSLDGPEQVITTSKEYTKITIDALLSTGHSFTVSTVGV